MPADGVRFALVDLGDMDEAALSVWAAWLGPDELRRHARFVRPERRRQFVAGRGLLRQMLGELLGIEPGMVTLDERPGMAPRLAVTGCAGVGFSISHSGPWVACVVSADRALGLDIEMMAPGRDFLALADQVFDTASCANLARLSPELLAPAFYRLWTRHEAGIKLGEEPATTVHHPHPQLSITLCSGRVGTPCPPAEPQAPT